MSSFELRELIFPKGSKDQPNESLRLSKNELNGVFRVFTGRQGEYFVSIIPSLNLSGYATTEEESIIALRENLETLFNDLFEATESQRKKELFKMGWRAQSFFKKNLTPSHVDENGILQNFDYPDQVKTSMLQAA